MAYRPLDYNHIQHEILRQILLHCDLLFRDLYQIFKIRSEDLTDDGAGNFTIAVMLLCIIDGLAVNLYPTKSIYDQEQRFKKLIRDKLPWGAAGKHWMEKGMAAKQLYLELRNPLVHELGADKATSIRQKGHSEPRVGKWGNVPKELQDIDQVEDMQEWNNDWPILAFMNNDKGNRYAQFNGAAMYWAVKKMIADLINDDSIINNATKFLNAQP
jgi:hypothetical protein